MLIVMCHPDNLEKLEKRWAEVPLSCNPSLARVALEIKGNPLLEKDEPTGLYHLPDGRKVKKGEIRIRERFVEYGPEDFPWLLYSGKIREERSMVVIMFEAPLMRMTFNPMPVFNPNSLMSFKGA